jgi:sulfite reductase alpha subunit-like flavoprotein
MDEHMDDLWAETAAKANHDAAPAAKAAASDRGTQREELGTGESPSGPRPVVTPITQKEWDDWLFGDDEGTLPALRKAAERLGRETAEKHFKAWEDALQKAFAPQPVAYCIQCEPGDPKVHSLSFDKASLERVVTRHGGKIVGLYLREPAT